MVKDREPQCLQPRREKIMMQHASATISNHKVTRIILFPPARHLLNAKLRLDIRTAAHYSYPVSVFKDDRRKIALIISYKV